MTAYCIEEATDGLFSTFKQTWDDPELGWRSIPGLTEEPHVRYTNLGEENEKDVSTDKPWLWISVMHSEPENVTFGMGRPVYEARGVVFIQVFTPLGKGLTLDRRIVKVVKRAYQGRRGPGEFCGIIFRGVRPRELGNEGRWHQTNVTVNFEYDEDTQ